MPVLPPVARKALIMVVGAVLVAGCSDSANSDDGPTAAEAGTRLATDARALLDKVQDLNNLERPYTVTDDASKDVPCGDDMAKRSFSAATVIPVGADLDDTLDTETLGAAGALPSRYKIAEQSGSDDLSRRQIALRDEEHGTVIRIQLRPRGQQIDYLVTGDTGCRPKAA